MNAYHLSTPLKEITAQSILQQTTCQGKINIAPRVNEPENSGRSTLTIVTGLLLNRW